MHIFEKEISVSARHEDKELLSHLSEAAQKHLGPGEALVRFVVTRSNSEQFHCDMGILSGACDNGVRDSVFRFVKREFENTSGFNVAFLVPTGIGAEIGGHAGDAAPVVRMLSSACDTLITHPNVVNASDINEIPENGLYVEGSVICRLLMGTIGLQRVRSNRVLVVIDNHQDKAFVSAAVNSVSGARSAYGFHCSKVVQLSPPIKLKGRYTSTGRAAGRIENLDSLLKVLDELKGEYDAIAISSVIDVPYSYHLDYFRSEGAIINPWGGVEAMLTHAISEIYNVPSAHSPMFESQEIANLDPGIVDPRMASEAVSMTFLQCILKGLQRSPQILTSGNVLQSEGVISAKDISALVIPDGCIGLPTLAALEQGIPVIAVKENKNIMRNNLAQLPWRPNQFYSVENYWEAAGVLLALKAGVAPESLRRPLEKTIIETFNLIEARAL